MTSLTVRRKVAKNPRRKAVAKRRTTKSRKALAHRKRNAMGHFVKAKNPTRRKVRAVAKHAKRRRKSNSSTSSIRAAVSSAVRAALKSNPSKRNWGGSMEKDRSWGASERAHRKAVLQERRSHKAHLKQMAKMEKEIARKKKAKNPGPALLVTLGAQNPRRTMAKAKRRNPSRRRRNTRVVARRKTSRNPFAMRARTANPHRRSHRRRNGRVVARRRNGLRRRRNPSVFGANIPSGSMVKLLLGGLIGVTATKMITAMIPPNMLSNNFVKVLASGAVAVVAGNLAKAVPSMGPGFSDAVMFGGLMQAASVALNTFLPSVGSRIALAGRRGVGDIVDARFSLPENTITNGMLAASARALPAAVPAGAMAGLQRAGFGGGF